jgi:hypothetical protein
MSVVKSGSIAANIDSTHPLSAWSTIGVIAAMALLPQQPRTLGALESISLLGLLELKLIVESNE